MKEKGQFNLEEIKKKALEQFRSGKSLYGKDGAFAPMLKSFLEAALEGEPLSSASISLVLLLL
ncbi:MAG: hypothetical protein ACK47E_08700 [Cyclobacteriaceae bacterium]